MKHYLFAIAAAGVGLAGQAACAATLSGAELLNQFSIITTGDLDANHDNYGRAYVGGNLTTTSGKADFANPPALPDGRPGKLPASDYAALTVVGDVTGGPARIGTGGTTMVIGGNVANRELQFADANTAEVLIGGALSPATLINNRARPGQPGVRVSQGLAGTAGFADLFPQDVAATLTCLSGDLSDLDGTITPTITGGGNTFNLTATGGGLSVANFDIADLGGHIGQMQLALGATDTLVMNVGGTNVTINDNINGLLPPNGKRIIWNFYEAVTVDLQRQMIGSILAPKAVLKNNTAIEGSIFAASAQLGGQVHLQPFEGDLPEASPVPLPASLPLLLAGLGLAGFVARRRAA
ncbi:choice-of-anchor A family protein [Pseudoroseicyclus aestuarii]|uniref:Putative secreted protein n=1 Tax=Pseudoroseicyclus aestuarii TaxID=1795041 RepID=A0A318STN9_9RHOB|nr:choice-of-anchor A family protein [Pseudoroseicyclus aestuarii]PYE85013.1 putative secreted protein [Pseudoroseicyclus aestuarii]